MSGRSPKPDAVAGAPGAARVHALSNGVRVICDPMPGLETVALSVVAGRGARAEDAARSG
jgi:predicted Zn-dependent peptidase